MKLLFSVPTGYHLRELLLPLRDFLTQDSGISQVTVITPAAAAKDQLFPEWDPKFTFVANPADSTGHKQLMAQSKPDLVITDTVGHDEKDYPILVAAKGSGIRTLTFIASWDNVWKIERLLKTPNRVALADHFIVWNQLMKEHLRRIFPDIDEGRITIIGSPRLDYYFHAEKIPTKEQLYRVLGFNDPSWPLIHFSTTELYPMDYIVAAVRGAMDKGALPKNLALLATVHPGGNLSRHLSLQKYGATVRYAFGRQEQAPHPSFTYNPTLKEIYNSIALYKHTAVLINHSSTTALESLVADVPVINVTYGQPWDWWHWYRSMVYRDFQQHYADVISDGATTVVSSPRQLIAAINAYVQDPALHRQQRQKTLKKMITTTDGTASQQVVALIKRQASYP